MRWLLWCFCLMAESYETINHFDIKFVIITPSESNLFFRWIITNFQKVACFEQFLWAWYNIFASFFFWMFRTCSFICLHLFCRNTSFCHITFHAFLRLFNFTREPRIHWKKCGSPGKVRFTLATVALVLLSVLHKL